MIRNHSLRQLIHDLRQDLLVNLPRRERIRQSLVNVPLPNLLIILVIPAEDDERRMMPESRVVRDSLLLYRIHKLRVRWIDATCELEVLQEGYPAV
jgi:hypothetical protein